MASVNVNLSSASIQVLDLTTNLFRINSAVGTITLAATTAFYEPYFQAAAGAGSVLALPAATVWVAYIKNQHATQNLQVLFAVTGGALLPASNAPLLVPGAAFMYWSPSEGAGGITAITLVGSGANTSCEVLLAA